MYCKTLEKCVEYCSKNILRRKKMYCKNCGEQVTEVDKYCPGCGKSVSEVQQVSNSSNQYQGSVDQANFGFAILGFIVPIAGIILYFIWKNEYPLKARSCIRGALVSISIAVIIVVLSLVVAVSGYGYVNLM